MQVVWNKKAEYHLVQAITYGAEVFGKKAAKHFFRQIKDNDARLAANPYLGKKEPLLEDQPIVYRSLIVHSHYKLIYHIEADTIYIAALFDTRMNPASLTDQI